MNKKQVLLLCIANLLLISRVGCWETAMNPRQKMSGHYGSNYMIGKRSTTNLKKRWGLSDLTDSVSGAASNVVDTVSDVSSDTLDKATDLKDTVVEQGQDVGESIQDAAGDLPLPSSPSEVKDIAQGLELSDVMILADDLGLPSDLDSVLSLAEKLGVEVTDDDIMNLIAEVEMSDLEEVLKEIPVEDLVALAGGVASQVPQSGGGGSSESAVVSIEIMDKLTAARMMIDNIESCKLQDEAPKEEENSVKRLQPIMAGKRPKPIMAGKRLYPIMAGKRMGGLLNRMSKKSGGLLKYFKRTGGLLHFMKRSGGLLNYFKRSGGLLNHFNKRSGGLLHFMSRKRVSGNFYEIMSNNQANVKPGSLVGKRDAEVVPSSTGISQGELAKIIESGAKLATDAVPDHQALMPSTGSTASLYTILEGVNDLIARLDQIST
ncbi:uncharacterized protein LOC134854085 isoform X4 [Symsagittifera roscoffensis]|uniref:uncharacterized protein LOC134854085 isoform X4 n=1 Tax=Symsagittifera roscoffensis TaxID=84072 RepID=UPI00307C1082